MFRESVPGAEGTTQERADKLEVELKRAQNRISALEAQASQGRNRFGVGAENLKQSVADGARSIMQDIRAGRPVSPEDLFRAGKPLMRDLAPLFDRVRLKEQRKWIDATTGEFARKYGLNSQDQVALKQWFDAKAREEAQRWSDMIGRDDTRLEDVVRASRDVRLDAGIETFMAGVLPAEKLASFKSARLAERAERVQREADMKVQRLNSIVTLDEEQRDLVFGVAARGSRDYDPAMAIDGERGQIATAPVANTQEAILSVLNPDQRAAYDAELRRRREEAEKDLNAVGLTLPPNWEMLNDADFK
jgi:hypothetical protein